MGHPLLQSYHIFNVAPNGLTNAPLLLADNVLHSTGDYGCLWRGGYEDQPLDRGLLRDAMEMGANIAVYASGLRRTVRVLGPQG